MSQQIYELIDSVKGGRVQQVTTLLDRSPGIIDGQDWDGETALHYASGHGNTEVAQLLLDRGADKDIQNKEGKTALDLAKDGAMREVFRGHPARVKAAAAAAAQRLLFLIGGAGGGGGDVGGRDACRDLLVRRRALQEQLRLGEEAADKSVGYAAGYAAGFRARQQVQASFRKSFEQLDAESALLSVSEGEFLAVPSAVEQLLQELRGRCEEASETDDAAVEQCLAQITQLEAVQLQHWQISVDPAAAALKAAAVAAAAAAATTAVEAAAVEAAAAERIYVAQQAEETRIRDAASEHALLSAQLEEQWGAQVAARILAACSTWPTVPPSALLPAPARSLAAAEEVLGKLAHSQGTSSEARGAVDTAIAALERAPLDVWEHQQAYLAAAFTSPTHIACDRGDAEECVAAYVQQLAEAEEAVLLAPVLLLALARLTSPAQAPFRAACLRRCLVHDVGSLMDPQERDIAASPPGFLSPVVVPQAPESVQMRWARLQREPLALPSPSIDKLMGLVGLGAVKEQVLGVYQSVLAEQRRPLLRVKQSHNFCLLGNPGTGKTTVARLLGGALKELGVRRTEEFVDTTGEKLARMGADKVAQEIGRATGGVLFVDEAYGLEPERNLTAAAVAMQLLDAAEELRGDLTVILAGYKEDMETKLFAFNDGFSRRFPNDFTLSFEDYDVAELGEIFSLLCAEVGWLAGEEVVQVAARRAARGRGNKGFGNAGAVRGLFEGAHRRALARDPDAQSLQVQDVLGPRPDTAHETKLGAALAKLDALEGLDSVKKRVLQLVHTAKTNYDRELRGEPPFEVSLNRVFLGNPGTGKTTVARIYGRVLQELGLLSDGAWEDKQASDLIGSAVGESEKLTKALVKRSMGKVLFIDEAYALNNSPFGRSALDTLVGLVTGAPGEDIAVVVAGYEKQIKKMFREANGGLSSRFDLDDAFRFEDFGDADLGRVVRAEVERAGLRVSRDVRKAVITHLAVLRARPNFGNARAAKALVTRAKERLLSRDAACSDLSKADFGLERSAGTGADALAGLYKVEHVREELADLRAVIKQCEADGRGISQFLRSYVFIGSSGTGKTTVAMALAQLLHEMGILGRDSVKVVSGLDLQGSYVGQTKVKVDEAMKEAQGGVLFIDEAYTLGGGGYGREAVDQLVALMTLPEYVHSTVVVLAGYPEQMEQMLLSNSGLLGRFTGRMHFPDWDAADCVGRIAAQCEREGIKLTQPASAHLLADLDKIRSRPGWANARDSVTTYDLLYAARARRCAAVAESGGAAFLLCDAVEAMGKLRLQRPHGGGRHVSAQLLSLPKAPGPAFAPAPAPSAFLPPPALTWQAEEQAEAQTEAQTEGQGAGQGATEQKVEEREREEQEVSDKDKAVFAVLLYVCKQAGYDAGHGKRQQLVAILEAVQGGGAFPADILQPLLDESGLSEVRAMRMLKPQVHIVLAGMRNAVAAEEARLAEVYRLQEEERAAVQARYEAQVAEIERRRAELSRREQEERAAAAEQARLAELRRIKEEKRAAERARETHMARLQQIGNCVQGYSWHREGSGWRCAGGAHYCSDAALSSL